jgi:protein-tyrosine phosphatase
MSKSLPLPKRGRSRQEVVGKFIERAIHSPVCFFIWSIVFSISIVLISSKLFGRRRGAPLTANNNRFYSPVSLVFLFPMYYLYSRYSQIRFDCLLLINSILIQTGYCDAYNTVDDNLYLGKIPITEEILNILSKKMAIQSVLGLVDNHELANNMNCIGKCACSETFRFIEMHFKQLPIKDDLRNLSSSYLHEAADWLNRELSENKRVFVYCRSGTGASACAICAYFVKYKGMNSNHALKQLRGRCKGLYPYNTKTLTNIITTFERSFRVVK